MNRNLIIIVGIFLAIIATMLTGNIIIIGDKIGRLTHVYVEYAFYLALLLASAFFILRPIVRVHRAPEFPRLSAEGMSDAKELRTFARRLANNCGYIDNKEQRRRHRAELLSNISFHSAEPTELKDIVTQEIALRMQGDKQRGVLGVDNRIKEWGKTVFMITALSQNSTFDTLAVLVLNYRLISDLVLASGFRPTKPQLFRLYVKVLTTALVTYCTSQVFADMDSVTPFDFGDDLPDTDDMDIGDMDVDSEEGSTVFGTLLGKLQKVQIPGIVVGSVADGCVNALMTMRIGYVTKAYLTEGPEALSGAQNKRRVKRQAIKESIKALPGVLKSGSAAMGKTVSSLISRVFSSQE